MSPTHTVGFGKDNGRTVPSAANVLRTNYTSALPEVPRKVDTSGSDVSTRPLPRLEVRQSNLPKAGLGLFTTEDIPAYTRVLEDSALLSLAQGEDLPELWQKYSALPAEDKDTFGQLSLPDAYVMKGFTMVEKLTERGYDQEEAMHMARVSSVFQANGFKTAGSVQQPKTEGREGSEWAVALFPTVARINHSCVPNLHAHYDPSSGAQIIYSLRDISAGAELTISYFQITMPRAARQKRAGDWGFTCTCPACSGIDIFKDEGYELSLMMVQHALGGQFDTSKIFNGPTPAIENINRAIQIASRSFMPWLVAALPALYVKLGCLIQYGYSHRPDLFSEQYEKILSSLREAVVWESRITGPNSPPSRQRKKFMDEMAVILKEIESRSGERKD
ncbi:hypothetical protein LTR09_000120 [Extremus antarcticus]|uniref:SET domain-containing protein n=1 Tax=Extremus antarcticus TaxID=702011 RepID=A0AAJ0GJ66_9PEZI|nr:hypothetical protein LTR09_000120 [Extremus antarcticus]